MLNYDDEAAGYDASRGGEARAEAAADALTELLPGDARLVADLACGTGIVTARLRRPGREVFGLDLSPGMARVAAGRLPGRVQVADGRRLPLRSGVVDAVVMVWLLHLLAAETAEAVFAEAARVVAPGGVLLTTVEKHGAALLPPSDVAELIAPVRARCALPHADGLARLTELGTAHGLHPTGRTTFTGLGQGRSPQEWRTQLLAGRFDWTSRTTELPALCEQLRALPDQDRPRPDPVYQLVRFTKA
ncbi:SAM-dependent methyltransferase [Kitasatospora sp. MMS16-BH015]|uniref:class I SAM-dependent methyltransferase n=1 Tax=Kitasatospora sp. MMS16-BH015 TaxID=2018025 RepID=UPI000CA35DEC|nr:class I SAM-dependent methyltransferase [Kitasatospora sp. MMS16-BH015]AUG80652.1 SAM-dependent methyltransferase [Kitasatospora sp. MMS16-BH015]